MSPAVVIGIGQDAAGDDGVGLAVARRLCALGVDARPCADASTLLDALGDGARVVVVDAVVGAGVAGTVARLRPDALAEGVAPVSTHGLGVMEALSLARVLHGEDVTKRVALVAVAIEAAQRHTVAMSPAVAAAVEEAATLARALAEADDA